MIIVIISGRRLKASQQRPSRCSGGATSFTFKTWLVTEKYTELADLFGVYIAITRSVWLRIRSYVKLLLKISQSLKISHKLCFSSFGAKLQLHWTMC